VSGGTEGEPTPERPPLRLVRGDATPEELAALLAVLSAASEAEADSERDASARPTSRWAAREAGMRRVATPGPGAWRAAGWPR
jgi:hypothetical protein